MSKVKPIILVLTTHTGGGHMNIAQSLQEMLEDDYEVVIENAQSIAANRWYSWVSRYGVGFLHWQYAFTDNKILSFGFHLILTSMSYKRIKGIVERVQPQIIITAQAFLSFATARVNERQSKPVPLVFQFTDLGRLHMTYFTEKHAAAYLAPTREIFEQALEQNIERSCLFLTGRPIRRQFLDVLPAEKHEVLAGLGLDPAHFTIFLQGGAEGSAGVDQMLESLLEVDVPIQIILAVGNNKKMAVRYAGDKRVCTLPFTKRIAPYMAAADIIVGKAGASFISEAFILEKPFLVTTFIPGQETPNLGFIEQHNLGWVCLNAPSQQELLVKIANNPKLLAEKVESIRAYKAWNKEANQKLHAIIDRLLVS